MKEALKLALEALEKLTDAAEGFSVSGVYFNEELWARKCLDDAYDAMGFAQEALAQPEQEPVAFDVQKALRRAYHLGQSYWADADSESYAANKRSDKHRQNFDELCEEALAYTTPPQRTWVGLTDEEKQEWIDAMPYDPQPRHCMTLVNIIEAKLKEKNT